VLAAVWIGLAGCGAEPAAPSDPPLEAPAASSAVRTTREISAASVATPAAAAADTKLDFSDEIADLRGRFLPSLQPPAARALGQALDQLAARAGDPAGAATTLARAAAALHEHDAAPADLDALRRTLAAMQAALTPPTSHRVTRSGGTDDTRTR
jgi:hypothetical protein